MKDYTSLNTKTKLGVLGGGQLGLMITQSAISYGLGIHVLDPDSHCSCRPFTNAFTQGSFRDEETVFNFGKDLDFITLEIEHVSVPALYRLEKKGVKVFPQARIVEMIQDKGLQKKFLQENGFATAPFYFLESRNEIHDYTHFLPAVLKSRKGGYDGKGVRQIRNTHEIKAVILENFPEGSCILETRADLVIEISVLVARNLAGEISVYDPVQMEFNPVANLVEFLIAPARISTEQKEKAQSLAKELIRKMDMVGLLAVEMFILKNGEIWINEMAPRPHNSGHHSIEACWTSQYEQLLRALLNLPLGHSGTRSPSVMVNLLGAEGYFGPPIYSGLEEVMQKEGVYVHLYGKQETKPMRKMGHITILGKELEKAYEEACTIRDIVTIIS